jgi:hypothetical protein
VSWQTFFTALVSSIGGASVILFVAIFIGKKWVGVRIEESVKHEYAKKLEEHKANLQDQANRAMETMKLEFQDAVDEKAADKSLYSKFIEAVPSSGAIEFIDKFNMAGFSFERTEIRQLHIFCYEWNDPEHCFLDNKLESLRADLHKAVVEYLDFLATNTWCCDGNMEYASVPAEWEDTDPKRFEKTVSKLHALAQKVVDAHRSLVSSARRKLKC